jgi:hypothetical protein
MWNHHLRRSSPGRLREHRRDTVELIPGRICALIKKQVASMMLLKIEMVIQCFA